jgi:hypothetical protein
MGLQVGICLLALQPKLAENESRRYGKMTKDQASFSKRRADALF